MGTDSYNGAGATLYMMDGEKLCEVSGVAELPEITTGLCEAGETFTPPPLLGELTITFEVRPPKHWRCRGRKRFVKLMMAEGIQRNKAVWLADVARTLMPYREAWRAYRLHEIRRRAYDNRPD